MAAADSRIGAANTILAVRVGPVVTAIFAVLLLQESFNMYHLIGMSLVSIGVTISGFHTTTAIRN